MPKPPPAGTPRPRSAILIHDDDDRSGGRGPHRESRPVVGMGGSVRGREGSSAAAARSPPPRRKPLAPSSPRVVIELGDDDVEGSERPEKVSPRVEARRLIKEEPQEYSGSDSEDSRARVRARAPASASGGSRKAGKRKRESPVRRAKPRRAGGRGEPGSSRKQRGRKGHASVSRHRLPYSSEEDGDAPAKKMKSAGRRRPGHKGGGSDWRGSAPARQVGAFVSSRTRSRNGDRREPAAVKYPAPYVSDDTGDNDEMEEVSSEDEEEDVVKGKNKVGENADSEEEEQDAMKGKNKEDDNADSEEEQDAMKGKNKEDDNADSDEEQDAMKGKNKEDDNADSEEMYKSVEDGEDGNGVHDGSYAGVDEEDSDDTTESEEEEGGEEESQEAGEEQRGTPSSNARAGGSARPGGDGTPRVRKKHFEGLCLIDKADTTSACEGVRKRTRSQRRCSDKKLLARGTFSKPYCIDVSESEPEEEVPPPAQTEQGQPPDYAFEDDDSGGDDRAPAKKRRRRQQIFDSDDSDSDDSSDDSDRTFATNAKKKGPSSGRPANGGAPHRQQQTANAKEGRSRTDQGGSSSPRRVQNYAANAGNPADRGNLHLQQGDVSFKKNSLLPLKGKRGGPSARKKTYDDLFNSIFDEIENHPNGSAPAQGAWEPQPLVFSFGDDEEPVVEKTEHEKYMDELWADMDLGLEILHESSKKPEEEEAKVEESNGQEIPADRETLCKQGKHDFIEDDQIGILCRHCYFVHTEIRHVMPPVGNLSAESPERDRLRLERELDRYVNDFIRKIEEEEGCIASNISGPVRNLIPGVWEDMFPHQREAFEFMWTKLAGGIDIEQVKKNVKSDTLSGCVVSHAPGTGKTRLAITFVQSYLELFPRCSPVIIAPKGMLTTWEDEFRKWNAKVPFHVLNSHHIHWNGDKTIETLAENDDDLARKLLDQEFRKDVKLLSWVEGNSVIGLSYKLFTNLTKECDDDDGKMRKLLLQRPDLLVLDEGHIPRNKKSKIWQALAQVRTQKRIILSGTPFQNNFEELHNILCLLRGSTHDVDPGFWTSLTLNNVTDERVNEIRTKLDSIVHIHNGDILQKSLPGLRESVVILNPLPMQKKIIAMMEKFEAQGNFHFEYKISLASVHPSLITSIKKLSDEVRSTVDEPSLERIRLKPCEGVKARFVCEIVRRCRSKERVLVFSQYLEPLDLIMEQLSKEFQWTKGKEILQMSGKVGVETRQSTIMAFNDMKSDAKVMLASTKACGEGIQLIGASRVVLLDVVWNPSVGRQAIGRAYRIGQEKIVYTYNLIAEGTQEKSKYDRQAQKEHMSKKLFSNESQPAQLSQSPEFIFNDTILEYMTEDENLKDMFMDILPSQ